MKIEHICAREIFDSRGIPTIEVELHLDDNAVMTSSVPSGMSLVMHEAKELRDGDGRLSGLGVQSAVEIIEEKIAPLFIGKEPDLINGDVDMIELDDTNDKSHLGANTMLAMSIALCKAQAYQENVSLYELIAQLCNFESVSVPKPMINMIGGGMHSNNGCDIQEYLIVPIHAISFQEAMEYSAAVHYSLKDVLKAKGKMIARGSEGEFIPLLRNNQEACDLLVSAIERAGVSDSVMISLDVAASHFYSIETGLYTWEGSQVTADFLIQTYKNFINHYPIYSIEDGLSQVDWHNWKIMKDELGKHIKLLGDDIFVTHSQRIWDGIERNIATGTLLKPGQVGTVTEALQAAALCKEHDWDIIASHRYGETNDDFLSDFSVGISASHIKAGGLSGGEHLAKYNRLMQIEDELLQKYAL